MAGVKRSLPSTTPASETERSDETCSPRTLSELQRLLRGPVSEPGAASEISDDDTDEDSPEQDSTAEDNTVKTNTEKENKA